MTANVVAVGGYLQSAASASASQAPRDLLGIFVSAASATPTITVYDDTGTGTTIKVVDTFTPVASTWYPLPFSFKKGINIVIGGTVSYTVSYL
jgi:hypothetical protein